MKCFDKVGTVTDFVFTSNRNEQSHRGWCGLAHDIKEKGSSNQGSIVWSIDGDYLESPCENDDVGRSWNGPKIEKQ